MAAFFGLAVWLVLEALRIVELHDAVPPTVLLGFAVPLLAAFVFDAYDRFAGTQLALPTWAPAVWMLGTLLMAAGSFAEVATLLGATAWLAAMMPMAIQAMKHAPKETLVNDDPLTKGDDACFKHLVFAHRFLPIGLLLLLAGAIAALWWPVAAQRLHVSAMHVLIIGYGLLVTYGVSHLWVPRFSGIPAIAAGAIKGELHTTLLGLTGLVLGFLTGRPDFLDISLLYALINFVGTIAILKFFRYRAIGDSPRPGPDTEVEG